MFDLHIEYIALTDAILTACLVVLLTVLVQVARTNSHRSPRCRCCCAAPQGAETEGVLQSAGLQEAEETQGGEERGESAQEPPQK